MSITFDRKAIMTAATKELIEHDRVAKTREAKVDQFCAGHRSQYDTAKLKRLRDWLTSEIRKGTRPAVQEARQAMKVSDIEHLFYSPPSEYDIKKAVERWPSGLLNEPQIRETRALLEVLKAAKGDVVTANELKLLGLTNLAHVFKAAAGEDARP